MLTIKAECWARCSRVDIGESLLSVVMKPRDATQLRPRLARVESGRKKRAAGGKLKFRRVLINTRKAMMEEESGGMYA